MPRETLSFSVIRFFGMDSTCFFVSCDAGRLVRAILDCHGRLGELVAPG